MFFHLRSALHSLKGALDEEWLYRGEPQLPPDLHAVGQRVVWHEFKTVYSVDDIPRSVALGLRPASRAGARGAPSAAGVMYRIRPRPGRHFGNLGAKLFAGDPCVGFGGGEGSEHQVLLPPGLGTFPSGTISQSAIRELNTYTMEKILKGGIEIEQGIQWHRLL